MKYSILALMVISLVGCDNQSSTSDRQSNSIMGNAVSNVVGGFAAGAGAAVGHHAINHGLQRWHERRSFRRR